VELLEFDGQRKLCKKNITQRTKYLIEKFLSKKHRKEANAQLEMVRAAVQQADLVKLDFEQEEEKKNQMVQESESKYYQAIRKLKFQDSDQMMSQEQVQLKRLKFHATHGNKGVDKALETANKLCQSEYLKVGLQYLTQEIEKKKRDISRRKNL